MNLTEYASRRLLIGPERPPAPLSDPVTLHEGPWGVH